LPYLETRQAGIEINTTIDIMLVFFAMITLRMIPATGHVTKFSSASTLVTIPTPKFLGEISGDGALLVENHVMSTTGLINLLRERD